MALFSRQTSQRENRIENAGRWPVRLTHFYLSDDYSFPATNYPEIFYVRKGGLLHETRSGKQTIREGFAMLVHPGHQHTISNPEGVVVSRIRFLPEWFAMEFSAIVEMPDVLTLFFDQSWLQLPRDDSLHVFNTQPQTRETIEVELKFLQQILRAGHHRSPLTRLSLLKVMAGLASDFQRYWRGAGGPELSPQVRFALDLIERRVFAGEPFREASLRGGEFDKADVETEFRSYTGLSPHEYADRRRIFHAAYYLIASEKDPKWIARMAGFADQAKFELAFNETFEVSPEVYREKFQSLQGPEETVA